MSYKTYTQRYQEKLARHKVAPAPVHAQPKPTSVPRGGGDGIATTILLTKGYHALIDAADYEKVTALHWRVKIDRDGRIYARGHKPGSGKRGIDIAMHRYIMDAEPGQRIDHRNGDTLDNRRKNLRRCTNSQNVCNQRRHRDAKTAKYKGVYLNRGSGRYRAQIMLAGVKINLGEFVSQEAAARCYDANARKLHGEFARLNFPVEATR